MSLEKLSEKDKPMEQIKSSIIYKFLYYKFIKKFID